ncbi:hypothetical protein ABW636_10715 [Aquimarina sp. 2201CG1-2-11]|uniref:hypothetical protein n=1 Tax=Aquimarina discodermiae TaxID=3231043 RepID=UPI0034634F66
MKNKKSTIESQEKSKPFIGDTSFNVSNDIDTPKPDGRDTGSNEEEDEDDKPGENIFK